MGEKSVFVNQNMHQYELRYAVTHTEDDAPPSFPAPKMGQRYFRKSNRIEYYFNGSIWVATVSTGYGIIQGNATWSGVGLIEDVTRGLYYIQGIFYDTLNSVQLEHDPADSTHTRIDVIAYTVNAEAIIIKGIAGPNPVKPSVDELTQIELTSVIIPAGATEPGVIVETVIYDENLGHPDEWEPSSIHSGVAFDSPLHPFSGTKSIYFPENAVIDGRIWFNLTSPAPVNRNTIDFIKFRLYLTAPGTDQYCTLAFMGSGGSINVPLQINNNSFGYDKTIINAYQFIVIPISSFQFVTNTPILALRFTEGDAVGSFIDRIVIQSGNDVVPTGPYVVSFNGRTGHVLPKTGDYPEVVIQCRIGDTAEVEGTTETVTGLTNDSQEIICEAFRGKKVRIDYGGKRIFVNKDPGDGEVWATKVLADNKINLESGKLFTGDKIIIETIPS